MPVDRIAPADTKAAHMEGNVKDTIESILIAFILAFIFRAFVVEAFVIPTGSMGSTLLGAHMRFQCPDCGYTWDVNYSARTDSTGRRRDDENIPSEDSIDKDSPFCQNCGCAIQTFDQSSGQSIKFPVHYGDRILVLKYAYLFQQPQRWDVVVFKSPHEDPVKPEQGRYSQNYIKRLVGRPGERVMVLDGDVYIGQAGETQEQFKIQRKPRLVQSALWRNVYDNDFIPRGLAGEWKQPWQINDGSGWDLHEGIQRARVFDFNNPSGSGKLYFNPAANAKTGRRAFPLTDWLAYDELNEGRRDRPSVGDLQIICDYERLEGNGALRLTLSKNNDTFTAEITPGSARLSWTDARGNINSTSAPGKVRELMGPGPVRLELANYDYRVTLCVNGREVLSTEDRYQPDIARLLTSETPRTVPTIEIAAEQQRSRVTHLKLSRDIYYLNHNPNGEPSNAHPSRIMELGPDEYFVLGDNSLISADARTWNNPANDEVSLPGENLYSKPGVVPGRFMLGKAFFVYWPAGYRPWPKAPFGIIPNFGDMRFIH